MNKNLISSLRYTISGWLVILMHLAAIIGVPILSYHFKSWWFLFGIAFVYIGFVLGGKGYFPRMIVLVIIGIVLCYFDFFNSKLISFYSLCILFGFVVMRLYWIIGLGDKTSRALISIVNPHVRKDIETEIEEEMKNLKKSE